MDKEDSTVAENEIARLSSEKRKVLESVYGKNDPTVSKYIEGYNEGMRDMFHLASASIMKNSVRNIINEIIKSKNGI